jgi:hydrogenase nickel incorporation protein HypA/HybF
MHEVSLVGSMLDIVEEYAGKHRFRKVNSLKLSFGALSCIDGSALQMAFDVLSKDTKARDASLEYTIHPIRILCLSCEQENSVEEFPAPCPKCKGDEVSLVGGFEDLKLEELDVD